MKFEKNSQHDYFQSPNLFNGFFFFFRRRKNLSWFQPSLYTKLYPEYSFIIRTACFGYLVCNSRIKTAQKLYHNFPVVYSTKPARVSQLLEEESFALVDYYQKKKLFPELVYNKPFNDAKCFPKAIFFRVVYTSHFERF